VATASAEGSLIRPAQSAGRGGARDVDGVCRSSARSEAHESGGGGQLGLALRERLGG
jgi:hypothetical protein